MNDIAEEPSFNPPAPSYAITPFVPIAAALVGIILGATALFISLSGKKGGDTTPEGLDQVGALQARLTQAEMQLVQLVDIASNNSEEIRSVSDQVQKALNDVSRTMAQLQSQVVSAGAKPAPASQSKPSPTASGSYKNYSIQPGDTFSKIAQKYGISTQTLLTLNPGVDPKRLQVGQGVKVPDHQN